MKKKSGAFKRRGLKDAAAVMREKPIRKILEFYYFPDGDVTARDILRHVGEKYDPKADIWPELNLAEVVLKWDSLIFQDAQQCFVDPLDLKYFEEKQITAKFQISFDVNDSEAVREVMKNVMTALGGRICSDTDEFEPSWTMDRLDAFPGELF